MKSIVVLLLILAGGVAMPVLADNEILVLKPDELRQLELESIPPWPDEIVLSGTNEHWQKVLHHGEYVVVVYEAMPAVIDISEPYPYDEYVQVLIGEVTLTDLNGSAKTFSPGESFNVPRGWMGTWAMPRKFREMIVVETKAWVATEG
jgi:uncharacterized cupin superfamily protein